MLGWMLIFGVMFLVSSITLALSVAQASLSLEFAAVISGFLLLASILTRLARGRA